MCLICRCGTNKYYNLAETTPSCENQKSNGDMCSDIPQECNSTAGLTCLGKAGSKKCLYELHFNNII